MKGSRPLTPDEVSSVSIHLSTRNKMLFVLGIKTGFRISELLSIKCADVIRDDGEIATTVSVARRNMKGNFSGRTVALHHEAREAIESWRKSCPRDNFPDAWLFAGPSGNPISRMQASRIIKSASKLAGVYDRISTHSMRKTFANRVYEKLGKDLLRTQKALGHMNISSTVSYLSFADSEVNDAILGA